MKVDPLLCWGVLEEQVDRRYFPAPTLLLVLCRKSVFQQCTMFLPLDNPGISKKGRNLHPELDTPVLLSSWRLFE